MQRAIDIINASGQGGSYRIYVSGTQYGCTTIPNTITTSKASKIEIIGLGNSRAVLTRPEVYSGGSILSIADGSENNLSPIILKNIQITGGQASEGAGIYIGTYGSVTLGAGALVGTEGTGLVTADNCGNMAYVESGPAPFGAGISCWGNLIMKKGSKVCRNYSASSTGGIYCGFGSVTIEHGAEVSDNRAFGSTGGIAINSGNLTMNGGSISGNIAGGDNGGLCITGSTTNPSLVTISGNSVISGNIAGLGKGGAVCVYNNTTFKISGSASIPYGVGTPAEYGPGKNDVYLAAGAVVTAGVLSGTGTVATITPYSWTRGLTVLKPDTSAISGITESIKNRFALTNDSFDLFVTYLLL